MMGQWRRLHGGRIAHFLPRRDLSAVEGGQEPRYALCGAQPETLGWPYVSDDVEHAGALVVGWCCQRCMKKAEAAK